MLCVFCTTSSIWRFAKYDHGDFPRDFILLLLTAFLLFSLVKASDEGIRLSHPPHLDIMANSPPLKKEAGKKGALRALKYFNACMFWERTAT